MIYQGRVIDTETGEPVPGATVELWAGDLMLLRGAADQSGFYSLVTQSTPDTIRISSASYIPQETAVNNSGAVVVYELQKNIVEGEPVIVTAKIKKPVLWLAAALVVVVLALNSKK